MDFNNYFSQAIEAIESKLEQKITGRRLLALHSAKIGQSIYSGEKPVFWVNVSVPFEIINCFPVASIYSEFIGAVLSGADMATPFLEKAEAMGYSLDGCSYHRALIGATAGGIVPKPIAVAASSAPCDGGMKIVAEVARLTDAPAYFISVPREISDLSIRYLADQLEGLVAFLEEKTGTAFDRDKFKRIIELSNQTADILNEVYAFGEVVPAPYNHKDLKNFQVIMLPLMGTEAGIDIAWAIRQEFADKVAAKQSGIPNEKIRLLWIQNRIQFANNLMDHIAENFGANIVWDELNDIYWDPIDPDDPYIGLAKRLIGNPICASVEKRLEILTKRSVQYKIDGAIHPSNWGCRQSQNARALFINALKEINVPMLPLDVDCVDKRSFSQGQLLTRLEAFCEMIKA